MVTPRAAGSLPRSHEGTTSPSKSAWFLLMVCCAISFILGMTASLSLFVDSLCSSMIPNEGGLRTRLTENNVKQKIAEAREAWQKQSEFDHEERIGAAVSAKISEIEAELVIKYENLFRERIDAEVARICQTTDKLSGDTLDDMVNTRVKAILADMDHVHTQLQSCESSPQNATDSIFPTSSMGGFAAGLSRTPKSSFVSHIELGVPVDPPSQGRSEVLILHSKTTALPSSLQNTSESRTAVPLLTESSEALENCDYLNVVLTDHSGTRRQCIAIVPQYESYHLLKYMRVDRGTNTFRSATGSLQLVSRGFLSKGRSQFEPPTMQETMQHWYLLKNYLETFDSVKDDLRPILKEIARDNTVIVMVCNFGQSELLMNFVCSAKARGFDLSNIIVFTTDKESTDIAILLGLTTYYDQRNFGDIPSEAAQAYGDPRFVAMMMAKVICVQLVSMLGYNFLFQDVDVVWFKNPLDYFLLGEAATEYRDIDIFFQDDGGHSVRYAPYSANSGFYYVRNSDLTRNFLTSILMSGDMVLRANSHQQALVAILSEHVSLYGLKVKVFARNTPNFPGGYQYHLKSGEYMKAFYSGKVHPYIFHMSWTHNKENKLLFFKQMGEWYVQEGCIGKKVLEIQGDNVVSSCCSAEPLISCHYRDKPSKIPCRDSPPIDKNRKSFW